MRKNIRYALIILASVNLFLFLTGILIPQLISTDKMPLIGIIFSITCMAVAVVTVIAWVLNHFDKKLSENVYTHISLDLEDFKCLTRGGILTVKKEKVRIILKDIGFYKMEEAIMEAADGKETYKEHIKEN